MRFLSGLAMFVLPITLAIAWWQIDFLLEHAPEFRALPLYPETITPSMQICGFLISMISVGILLYGLSRLHRLFRLFEEGEMFSLAAVSHLRSFSLSILVSAIASPIVGGLLSMLLTLNNPPGERALSLSFGSGELQTAFVGGVFLTVAHILCEGRRIADENAQIV